MRRWLPPYAWRPMSGAVQQRSRATCDWSGSTEESSGKVHDKRTKTVRERRRFLGIFTTSETVTQTEQTCTDVGPSGELCRKYTRVRRWAGSLFRRVRRATLSALGQPDTPPAALCPLGTGT